MVVKETPHPLFPLPPDVVRAFRQVSERDAFLLSGVLHDRHKFRLYEGLQIGSRVVGAIVLSPTDTASYKALVGSVQRVVVARAWATRDAAVPVHLEYIDC